MTIALIVEDGSGVFGANSYDTRVPALAYFTQRGNTAWTAVTVTNDQRDSALINATDYIEKKYGTRFAGSRLYQTKKKSEATLSFTGQPTEADTILIGAKTYRMTATLSAENDVQIGTKVSDTMNNLIAAINYQTGYYHPSTSQNIDVEASLLDGRKILLQARYEGEDGDDVDVTVTSTAITCNFTSLMGGNLYGITQPLSFPRNNLFFEGYPLYGVPQFLKFALYEFAVRALEFELMPDPVADESGRIVTGKTEKVGPIEETVSYSGYATIENAMGSYPGADRILKPLLGGGGGVSR